MTNATACESPNGPARAKAAKAAAKLRQWQLAATVDVTRDMIQANVIARACKGCEDSAITLLGMW